jgi:hypothetical protein
MIDIQFTPNFRFSELTVSQVAARMGIKNDPSPEELANLRELARALEQVRRVLGSHPIHVSSGFRCKELNDRVGGAMDSDHLYGLAVDFTCPRYGTPREICIALRASSLPFRQLILEYDKWVHFSIPREGEQPKREILTKTGTGYQRGIVG